MRLSEVVATSAAVGDTRSRGRKVALLADCLRDADPAELPVAANYLAGRTPQGRVSVGWRTIAALDVSAAQETGLALLDVDRALDELSSVAGTGSRARREQILVDLMGRATADEQRWLKGLLVGELRQGALDGIVAQALGRAWEISEEVVRRALMLSGDLGEVAEAAARGGAEALRAFRLTLFRPVQPMLASTAASVEEALAEIGEATVETKLDGARVQVHRDGDTVRVYSRSLREITGEFPGVAEAARRLPARSFVLDGEALGMAADGRPLPFQETMSGRGSGGGGSLRPFFFDCLHVDGDDLLEAPLAERRARLEALAPSEALVPARGATDAGAALAALRDALDAGHEGVMVKDRGSVYAAGSRGAAWRKVKPVHTLDLVILAAEWGSGRRRGWLSNLHLGARDPEGGLVMLGKTFKGLTDEMLGWQTERLLGLETGRRGHIVDVKPEVVVEIAFDGLQRSTRYPGGLALRFARVKRYRTDKDPADADTIDTVRAIARGELPPRV